MCNKLGAEQTIIPAWNMTMQSNKIEKYLVFHSERGSSMIVNFSLISSKVIN